MADPELLWTITLSLSLSNTTRERNIFRKPINFLFYLIILKESDDYGKLKKKSWLRLQKVGVRAVGSQNWREREIEVQLSH